LFIAGIATFFIWSFVRYKIDQDPNKTYLLPHLESAVIEITSLTADRTDLILKLLVKNELPFGFTADSLEYRIFMNDEEVIKNRYTKSINLERNNNNWISLPITLFNKNLEKIILANKRGAIDSMEFHLQASFYTNLLFKKKFTIDATQVLPLINIPEVEVEHVKIDSLNFNRAALELSLIIKNQNSFSIKAKDISYRLAIEDHQWIRGAIPGLVDIKAEGNTQLEIPLRISFKEINKTLFDLLKHGKNVRYKLHFTVRIESENKIIKDSQVIIESSGTVKSLLKALNTN
jgi:LEA14-like dessication related protein